MQQGVKSCILDNVDLSFGRGRQNDGGFTMRAEGVRGGADPLPRGAGGARGRKTTEATARVRRVARRENAGGGHGRRAEGGAGEGGGCAGGARRVCLQM